LYYPFEVKGKRENGLTDDGYTDNR
jgi:hypothetical protein